jgi:hypothetical protein
MIAFATVGSARHATLSQSEFSSSFQLLRTVGASGARSYHALEVATGNVVTVHLMDRDDHERQARLAEQLSALPDASRGGLLIGDVNGIPLVVTQFVTGLSPLRSWLDASSHGEEVLSDPAADSPSEPDSIADTDEDAALTIFDEPPVVDIASLAPLEPGAAALESERPSVVETVPQPFDVDAKAAVAALKPFVPSISVTPPPPPPVAPFPHPPMRSTAGSSHRTAPRIIAGPPGQSFIAPAASSNLSFIGSIAGLLSLGMLLGGAVYFMARG